MRSSTEDEPPRSDDLWRRRSGLGLLPLALLAYFGVGSINVFPYRGTVGDAVVKLLALGLAGLFLGYFVGRALDLRRDLGKSLDTTTKIPKISPNRLRTFIRAFGIIGLIALALTLVTFRGLPLLVGGDQRSQISPKLSALVYGLVVAVAAYGVRSIYRDNRIRSGLFVLLACAVMLLMGFRTLPLVTVGTILVAGWVVGAIRPRARLFVLLTAIIVGASWVGVWRFGHAQQGGFFPPLYDEGMPHWFAPLAPMWIVPREGVSVLNELVSIVPTQVPFAHGHVFTSSFRLSFGGSHHLSARQIVGNDIGGRAGVTITPSILGEPYLDFGRTGVFAIPAVLGFCLYSMSRWQRNARTWAPTFAYAYFLATLLIDVHSGFLDPEAFGSIAIAILFAIDSELGAKTDLEKRSSSATSGGMSTKLAAARP